MTGYASLQIPSDLGQLNLELRSVNHRFFELQVKADELLRGYEPWIRELCASKIQRGKIECKLSLHRQTQAQGQAQLDQAALQQLLQLQQQVLQAAPQSGTLSVKEILAWPGVMPESPSDLAAIEPIVKTGLQQLLNDFLAYRAREGEKLAIFMRQKNQHMQHQLSHLPALLSSAMQAYQAKLQAKLQEAVGQVDGDRLQQEIAYFAQRVDVEEEISRLQVHCAELDNIFNKGGPVGKQLDFLMQEFNREANTLASKSISNEITQIALSLKVTIEQMREQVQNIE